MGKKKEAVPAVAAGSPVVFRTLGQLLKCAKWAVGIERPYKVLVPNGRGDGETYYVVTNSPLRAAAAVRRLNDAGRFDVCHVVAMTNKELLRGYKDMMHAPLQPEDKLVVPDESAPAEEGPDDAE
jgi:hypothetical protein